MAFQRIARSACTAAMTLALGLGALGSAPARADAVDTWVTVATNHPAAGCVVETTVEVRSGGSPLADADVQIILSDDATATILDSDSGTTSGDGIAWLSFDTGWSGAEKTWLEVRVNGSYLGGRTIWVDGDACSGAPSILDLSGDAPVVRDSWVEAPVTDSVSSASGGELPLVTYAQQRPLSCEYAAVQIATSMIGYTVSEYEIESVTPLSANPHWGYRGDINGSWGNTTDYGIYAEALVPGLNDYGYDATAFYGDSTTLTDAIDAGLPVIVWLGMQGDQSYYETTSDGTQYQLTAYMHVMVVYAYDDSGVYLADPGNGGTRYYDWGTFLWMWGIIDEMGLIVGA